MDKYLKRNAYENLLLWKKREHHATLEVSGARQVGKTYIVNKFADEQYQHKIYINLLDFTGELFLERYKELRNEILHGLQCANPVYELIKRAYPNFVDSSDTVVIIDEIQESADIYNRTFKYLNGEPMIAKFGSDVIKFFIRSEEKDTNGRRDSDILDLFSEKRKDRFTISHYEKNEIVDLLGKFYSCNKNSDIINQFLLEQCFAMDITENICDFIEIVFPADKLTKNDIKTYVAKYIDCFVAEIRRCVPTFSKLLILEETKNLLFEQKYVDKDCKDYIKQGCEKLELASHVVAVLSEEMNFLHYNFYNQFIYAIIQKYNGNFENAKNDLMNEIIRTKKKLHVERYATYEYMDVRVFKAVERRKHDELFPYVQKAMMTEYTF